MDRVVLDHIVVAVDELAEQLREMQNDGMRFVEVSIAPPDDFGGVSLPARIDLSAVDGPNAPGAVDYDSVDAVAVHIGIFGN